MVPVDLHSVISTVWKWPLESESSKFVTSPNILSNPRVAKVHRSKSINDIPIIRAESLAPYSRTQHTHFLWQPVMTNHAPSAIVSIHFDLSPTSPILSDLPTKPFEISEEHPRTLTYKLFTHYKVRCNNARHLPPHNELVNSQVDFFTCL